MSDDTIKKILEQDELNQVADKIVNGNITEVILIYKENKRVCWETTCRSWATVFGEIEMIRQLVFEEWNTQAEEEKGEND